MTVSSTINKSGPYNGNGVTTAFEYEFRVLDETHLTVVKAVNGAETVLSLADYAVTGVGAQVGGSIVMDTAPATGETITIVRNAPFTQQVDLENQGAYYAETVEQAFDLAAMRDQMLAEGLSRTIQIPVSASPEELGALIADIVRLGDSADAIDTVAGISGAVSTVAGIAADVSEVSAIAPAVTAVAANDANVTTVASNIAAVNTAATNIAAIIAAPDHAEAAATARDEAEDARDAALGAVPSAFVATRIALKAINTAAFTAAYLKEAGREGQFLWRTGDFSTQIAADPLEGVYIKADAVAASSGAWVRQAGFLVTGLHASWFGAAPGAAMAVNTAGIQAALNLASVIGAGKAKVGGGEYLLGYTSETVGTTSTPNSFHYGLMVPSGIILEGEGRATVLKRGTVTAMTVVIVPFGNGSQVRNLRIDGNNTTYPITGATYGSGGGLWVESGSAGADRDTILDTVWIEDTPGYGIGATWGNHRGLTMRNIFINGTGSDGIDIKRMNSGAFDAYGIVLDNIHVEDFGRTATDAAQAGVDIRGYVTASNIHVRKFGAKARAGIRLRGGITTDLVIGAYRSTLTNYRVDRVSGGEAITFGLEVNADNVVTSNGMLDGCSINMVHILAGAATSAVDISHVNVQSFNESLYGFRVEQTFRGVRFIGCSAYNVTGAAFRIEGDDIKLIAPVIRGVGAGAIGIDITGTANNTSVIEPAYVGTFSMQMRTTGTNTFVSAGSTFGTGPNTGFAVDSSVGDSWVTATSLAGGAALVATSASADADIILSTRGAGFHAFGGTKTATTVGAAGGASALPATPTGYMRVKIGGTIRKIPYYAD